MGSFLVGPAVGFSSTLLTPLLKKTLMSSLKLNIYRTQKQHAVDVMFSSMTNVGKNGILIAVV